MPAISQRRFCASAAKLPMVIARLSSSCLIGVIALQVACARCMNMLATSTRAARARPHGAAATPGDDAGRRVLRAVPLEVPPAGVLVQSSSEVY